MNIRQLDSTTGLATVTLDYDELRCLSNSLYEVSKLEKDRKDNNFDNVYAKIIELFALVKHGMIPEFELNMMYKLLKAGEEDGE